MEETLITYAASFLSAMLEVEQALVLEEAQQDYLVQIETQQDLADQTLRLAQRRYLDGQADYLTVLTTLQAAQQLDLAELSARRQLLVYRVQLYRALGGAWTLELEPPPEEGDED